MPSSGTVFVIDGKTDRILIGSTVSETSQPGIKPHKKNIPFSIAVDAGTNKVAEHAWTNCYITSNSWLIPFLVDRRETKKQRGNLGKYMKQIDNAYLNEKQKDQEASRLIDILDKQRIELERPLNEGEINEDQFAILNEKISRYEDEVKR